jgi:anti-anti-sigma factor
MLSYEVEFEQRHSLAIAKPPGPHLSGTHMTELVVEMKLRIRMQNTQFFVLDMFQVEYMDSMAIGALVGFLQDLEHVHGRIALAHCNSNIEFLFKVTGLDAVVALFDEVEEAVEELA